jgi:hypothetical protein
MVALILLPKNNLRKDSKLMISMEMDSYLKMNSGNVWISELFGKKYIILLKLPKLLSHFGKKKKSYSLP